MVPCESTSEEVSFVCYVAPDALHFTIVTLLLLRLVYPSKVCIAIVPNFSGYYSHSRKIEKNAYLKKLGGKQGVLWAL